MTAPDDDLWVCPYCGRMGAPVTLQRSPDSPYTSVPTSTRADEHATDCPAYASTVQPIQVGR